MFSLNASGVGWHLPVGLIAVAALFIACFAISGYITFRDDSIPNTAMKDQDQDFGNMDADSLKLTGDNTVGGNLSVTGDAVVSGDLSAKVLAFQTGISELAGITPTALTDTAADTGFTAVANTAYASAWLADAGCAVTLPQATVGSLIMFRQTAIADGTGALVITRNAADSFNVNQSIAFMSIGNNVATNVGEVATAITANNTLTLTTHAAGIWGGIGSTLTLYCATAGVWSVNIPKAVGVGAASGGSVAFSTV